MTAPQLDELRELDPEWFVRMAAMRERVWQLSDPRLLRLARMRMGRLLRCTPGPDDTDDADMAELPHWPSSPRFSARDRACLALAEQHVIDAHGVTDAMVAEVATHLDDQELFAFVVGLGIAEYELRLGVALRTGER